MAITETPTKQACQMVLNIGTDAQGNARTANVSLGTLSGTDWDAQKAMNIVEALTPCLSRSVYDVLHVQTSRITD